MKRTALVALLALLALGPITTARAETRTVKVALASKVILDNLPIFVGMHMGFFNEVGQKIEPSYFPGGGAVVRAVSTRSVDIGGTVAASATLIAAAQGEPLRIVSSGTAPLVGIVWVVPSDSPLQSIKDLKGKTIAIPTRYSNQYLIIFKGMRDNGLLPSDVTLIEMPPPEMPTALEVRSVGACEERSHRTNHSQQHEIGPQSSAGPGGRVA